MTRELFRSRRTYDLLATKLHGADDSEELA
jgi:hypothetical protein